MILRGGSALLGTPALRSLRALTASHVRKAVLRQARATRAATGAGKHDGQGTDARSTYGAEDIVNDETTDRGSGVSGIESDDGGIPYRLYPTQELGLDEATLPAPPCIPAPDTAVALPATPITAPNVARGSNTHARGQNHGGSPSGLGYLYRGLYISGIRRSATAKASQAHIIKSKWRNIWIHGAFCYRISALLVLMANYVLNPALMSLNPIDWMLAAFQDSYSAAGEAGVGQYPDMCLP